MKERYALAVDTSFSDSGSPSLFAIECRTEAECRGALVSLNARNTMHNARIVSRLPNAPVAIVEHDSAVASRWFHPDAEHRALARALAPWRKIIAQRDALYRKVDEYVGQQAAEAATRRLILMVPLKDQRGFRSDCREGLLSDRVRADEVRRLFREGVIAGLVRADEVCDSYGYDVDLVVAQRSSRGGRRLVGNVSCSMTAFVHRPDLDLSRAVAIDDGMEVCSITAAVKALARTYTHREASRDPYFEVAGRR